MVLEQYYLILCANYYLSLRSLLTLHKINLDDNYNYIHVAGIWIRDIRFKSNIQMTQVNKIVKNLESKKLIKAVKSVAVSIIENCFIFPKTCQSCKVSSMQSSCWWTKGSHSSHWFNCHLATMCCSGKYPNPPLGGFLEIPRGLGVGWVSKPKFVRECLN